jgi:atypical dual specificity phosphatase
VLTHVCSFTNTGVRSVINMCTEYSGPVSYYSRLGMKQLRLPTVDHFEPTVEHMQEAVAFIRQAKERNERVYVHCKAGHGRAASIALCWLLAQNPSLSAKEGNDFLRAKRKVRATLYKQPNVMKFDELRSAALPKIVQQQLQQLPVSSESESRN